MLVVRSVRRDIARSNSSDASDISEDTLERPKWTLLRGDVFRQNKLQPMVNIGIQVFVMVLFTTRKSI